MVKRLIRIAAATVVALVVGVTAYAAVDKPLQPSAVTFNRIQTDASFVDPSQNAKARGGWFVEMVQ